MNQMNGGSTNSTSNGSDYDSDFPDKKMMGQTFREAS
jgi:hypothetical protein